MDTGDLLARNRFQSGLLTWLRAHAPHEYASGLREMIAVTRSLAAVGQSGSGDGLLWRSAGSFLQALLDGSLQTDDEARTLCRRLERQLANRSAEYRRDNADTLAQAIFAFVSNRDARHDSANSAPPAAIQDNNGFNAMLSDAFAATADILPLLGNTQPKRCTERQLEQWKIVVAELRRAWQTAQLGQPTDCRTASVALLQLALELADPACLKLADAFADAVGAVENDSIRNLPGFRAAFDAALEIAEHTDGPDQKGFAENVTTLVTRLAASAALPKASTGLVCASAPWFAEDARETLTELAAALDAVPPRRLALLAGFDWFAQHEAGKAMAIRGLATTAHKIIGQIRGDDLDEADTHTIIGHTIDALRLAVQQLANGLPPKPDEDAFAELRALDARISEQRQQAISAARIAAASISPPHSAPPSLQ